MSVRRLAEIAVQPLSFAFDEAFSAQAETWIAKYPEGRQQSAVIPLLMLAQDQEGWVTKAAIESIADMLRMPRIRALEVATFYTQFQLKPVGAKAHVQVCGTTPCMLRGSEALMDVCRGRIHHDQFHLNDARTLSWEEVECLGACVNAPMVMIGKDAYEDLTPERLAEIIDAFEGGQGAGVPVGPQNGRTVSIPASGATSLTDEQIFIDAARRRRQREDAGEARPGGALDDTSVPPSKAARPATDAPETNSAIKSPSPEKAADKSEGASRSQAPSFDAKAADKAEPAVEGSDKGRSHPRRGAEEPQEFKAPEYAAKPKAGESGNVAGGTVPEPDAPRPAAAEATGPAALGTSLGGGVAVSGKADAPGSVSHAGGQFVVDVSDSNAPRPGDEQVTAEREGGFAGPVEGVSLDHPDRPPGIAAPERLDDLKMISGIGPKIETTLHSLGIYTFGQIAGWNAAQRHWVDGALRFHGRIERDDWPRQAQALATGGEAEYVRVFGRKPR